MGVQLFLSSVSDEFRSYRDALRKELDQPNVSVKIQEDFIPTGTETLDKLDLYIRHCQAVIHLVGDMTGNRARPPSVAVIAKRYPDFGTRLPIMKPYLSETGPALSYTQWEAWLALYHDKPLLIAIPSSDAKRDEKYLPTAEQRAAQNSHLARLKECDRHSEITFDSVDRLVIKLARSPLMRILDPPEPLANEGLRNYIDAVRKMPTHGHVFTLEAARNAPFLYVSLRGQERAGSLRGDDPLPLDRVLASGSQCMWISGSPGAGKTTLLRHLARCAWSDPKAIGLDGPLLPAFVRLKCVAQATGASLSQRVKSAIDLARDIQTKGGEIPDDFLDRWKSLARRDWVLLLDAIDEVADKQRGAIFEWIAMLIDEGYRIVVTSRPNLTPPKTLEPRFAQVSISPLTESEQDALINGFLQAKAPAFRTALTAVSTKWSRENPLLLSLAAYVYKEDNDTLPQKRIDLYERAIALWQAEADSRDWKDHLGPTLEPYIDEALETIAFAMSSDPHLALVDELLPLVANRLANLKGEPTSFFQLDSTGGKLIRTLGRSTGFFEVIGNRCGWIHATLREYFAAKYLAKNIADYSEHSEFLDKTADPAWRHILLMYLTRLGDRREIDAQLLSLANAGPNSALFAAQALFEGARVTPETAMSTVQRLVEFTVMDAEQSICDSLLSSGHESRRDRLRLCAAFAKEPHFDAQTQWLTKTLASRCHAERNLDRRLGWNPQWFDYLRELGATDKLIALCDDNSASLISRAIALRALSHIDGESAAVRLEPQLDASVSESIPASILGLQALRLHRPELALRAFSCPAPDWRAINDLLDAFVKIKGLPEETAFLQSNPHPRAAIALASHGDELAVSATQLAIVRVVLREFLRIDRRTTLDNNGPPLDAFKKLILACTDHDSLIDDLFEYAAHEQLAVDVAYLIAETLSFERFTRWMTRATLSVGTACIVADGLLMCGLSAEDLPAAEHALERWRVQLERDTDFEIMFRFLGTRIAIQKGNWQAANDGVDAILRHPDIRLPFGRISFPISLAGGASLLKSQILRDSDDTEGAITALSAHLERNPNDARGHDQRANLLYGCGQYEEAIQDFEWIVENRFGVNPALLGKFAEEVGRAYTFSQSVEIGLSDGDAPFIDQQLRFEYDRQSMANFAHALLLVGRFGHATTIAGALTRDHDWTIVAHRLRGAAYLVIDPPQALDELNKAIELDESEVIARCTRAYLNRLNGDLADAKADVDQVLHLRPDHVDALHLSLELLAMHGPADAVPARVAELALLEVTEDVLRFAELCSKSQLTAETLAALESAVLVSYGNLRTSPEELGPEGLAHLVVYAVLLPTLADVASLIQIAVKSHRFSRLIETSLPLCRELGAKFNEVSARANDAVSRIEGALLRVAGRGQIAKSSKKVEPTYPTKNSYPFPMYCSKSVISGLEKAKDRCEKLLREHSTTLAATIAVIRLDPEERIYVQCNFKNDPHAEYKYKFCDSLATTLGKNLRTLVNSFGVSSLLFTEESLKAKFDDALQRSGLTAKTKLVQ